MKPQPNSIQSPNTMQRDDRYPEINDNLVLLNRSINQFNATADTLQASYKHLQQQVKNLNIELEQKNVQLKNNLAENEITRNFLNAVLESIPSGVFVIDRTKKLLMANKELSKIIGADLEQMETASYFNLLEKLMVIASPSPTVYNVELETGNSGVKYLKIIRTPVVSNRNKTPGLLHIVQDITRTARIDTQSERDKRLKAMGEMAIQVAHDVRNPLGSIELFASILRNELHHKIDLKKMTDHIINEVKSLDNAISNLLQFTQPQEAVFKETDLNNLLLNFIEFMKPLLQKNNVDIHYKEPDEPYLLHADRDLLKQVFLNLTLNAFQAMPDGGRLTIQIHSSIDRDGTARWAEISFADTGCGMDATTLNRIFNPFYSTREKGTGLGLAIVHNIIEGHHGTIEVRSQPQEGTVFQLTLPAQLLNEHVQEKRIMRNGK